MSIVSVKFSGCTYDPPVLERVTGRRQNGIDISPVVDVVQIGGSVLSAVPAVIDGWMVRFGNGTNVVGFFFFRRAAAPLKSEANSLFRFTLTHISWYEKSEFSNLPGDWIREAAIENSWNSCRIFLLANIVAHRNAAAAIGANILRMHIIR